MDGTFPSPLARARGRASASSALQQQLERSASSNRLGISRELSKLINKKTPTMTKEQVLRKVRQGMRDEAGEEGDDCIEGLTLYETYREPIMPHQDPNHTTTLQVRTLNVELTCPICLGIMRQTMTVMECLHRFCDECISKCLRWGKKECPTCRVHCSSRRHLRPDPNFDALIATVYPNLDEYEAQEEEFIADINKKMNRKSLTESVEKGIMRQAAASRGARGKRDREKLEAMEATPPASTPSRKRRSGTGSSASPTPSPSSYAPSSVSPRDRPSKRSKQPQDKRSKSSSNGGAEEPSADAGTGLELDALGIPLAHYHIPHRRGTSTAAGPSSPAVSTFLSQIDTFISFLLLPHPDDERLSATSSSSSSTSTSTNFALQRPYLRTSRKVTVNHINTFLATKFPQLLARDGDDGEAPSSLDLIVPLPPDQSSSASSSNSEGDTDAPRKQEARFKISIVPSTKKQRDEEEAKEEEKEKEKEKEDGDRMVEDVTGHVELELDQTIDAIAGQYWDHGKGDLTLYYRLASS